MRAARIAGEAGEKLADACAEYVEERISELGIVAAAPAPPASAKLLTREAAEEGRAARASRALERLEQRRAASAARGGR